mmetsp:Transcript_42343/g.120115  ORF Transcript_42343/g.120115 Transcript_42343/m.120115 type:complete len:211 (-) Transcript_42343:51-683(-)
MPRRLTLCWIRMSTAASLAPEMAAQMGCLPPAIPSSPLMSAPPWISALIMPRSRSRDDHLGRTTGMFSSPSSPAAQMEGMALPVKLSMARVTRGYGRPKIHHSPHSFINHSPPPSSSPRRSRGLTRASAACRWIRSATWSGLLNVRRMMPWASCFVASLVASSSKTMPVSESRSHPHGNVVSSSCDCLPDEVITWKLRTRSTMNQKEADA